MSIEVMKRETPKARIKHRCSWCSGVIEKGEVYDKQTILLDGRFYDWKSHKLCMKIVSFLDMYSYDDGYGVGRDDFVDAITEYHYEEVGQYVARDETLEYEYETDWDEAYAYVVKRMRDKEIKDAQNKITDKTKA
jgi:hypothetical protein